MIYVQEWSHRICWLQLGQLRRRETPNFWFHYSEEALHNSCVLIRVSYVVCRQYWQRNSIYGSNIPCLPSRASFLQRDFYLPLLPQLAVSGFVSPPLDCTAGFVPLGQLDLFSSDEGFVTVGNYFLVIRVNAPLWNIKAMSDLINHIFPYHSGLGAKHVSHQKRLHIKEKNSFTPVYLINFQL